MFSNSYGYGVYKRNQVNIGNPYQMKSFEPKQELEEEKEDLIDKVEVSDSDKDLLISQDIIYKAKEEAALIKREAELEAERIIREAQEKSEKIIQEVTQKSKEEGYRYGEQLAQQHYSDLLQEAQEYKDRCKTEYEETMASLEKDIVNLVLDIAAKVVGDEIRNNNEAILGVVRETILSCTNRDDVILKVSDEDYDFVVNNENKLYSMIKDINKLEIRMDGTLQKGSCIIETGFGSVDGSVDTRLESIKNAFLELLQDEMPDE